MSILIKGMEMPKSDSMIVAIRPDGMVEDVMGCYVGKAVHIPPHGRLIDGDELCDGLVSNHPVVIYAKSAPTIIPAEEGE